MNKTENIRWQLLVTVSMAALIGSACTAEADTDKKPTVWIEAGGQLESMNGDPSPFSPAFFSQIPTDNLAPMVRAQRPPPSAFGEEGKLSFEPTGSDWIFSAGVRYGRSQSARHFHHHTAVPSGLGSVYVFYKGLVLTTNFMQTKLSYGDGQTSLSETHFILDFQVGRDVGLGMFGAHGETTISAGVRIAQFTSASDFTFHAQNYTVNFATATTGKYRIPLRDHSNYAAVLQAKRSTQAMGPSISWDASVPIVGDVSDSSINFDWGVNAALLFGRQRAHVHHQTTGYHYHKFNVYQSADTGQYVNAPPDQNRSRSVTIPNIGGFAGLSFRYSDAKVSLGYRADFFFNAMDGGIDTRSSGNRSFYGPFANVSIGLGG